MKTSLLLAAALTLSLTACQGRDGAPAASDTTATSHAGHDMASGAHAGMAHDSAAAMAYSDVAYLDHMTEHHQMALDMARAVGERGASAEVRQMAEAIVRAQTAEIDTMKAWRARWHAGAPATPPMPAEHAAMMGMQMDMAGLQAASGAALDRLFLIDMIPHHAGAITMAAQAQKASGRPEIVALSRTIVSDQAREIADMQRLLSALPAGTTAGAGTAGAGTTAAGTAAAR